MRDLEWGTLAYLQDELAKQEDLKKKERETFHKRIYKNQLQRMIEEKNQYVRNAMAINRQREGQSYKSLDNDDRQFQRRVMLTKQSSQYNNEKANFQKTRVKSELEEEKFNQRQKFRKAETELSEQRQNKNLEKERLRKQLSQAYQSQISKSQSRKSLEKLQNHQFQKLAQQIESKRQIERSNNINKIKYGYSQNPETYRTIQNIYNQQQQMKKVFLRKIETQRNENSQAQLRRNHDIKQTSSFNRNNFDYQSLLKKERTLKQKEDDHYRLMTIQQELRQQQQKARQKKQQKAKLLQRQLKAQMDEAARSRINSKIMNPNQHRLNQSYLKLVQPVSIPGLYKDYKDIKKDEIIDNFLTNKKSSIPNPFWSMQK